MTLNAVCWPRNVAISASTLYSSSKFTNRIISPGGSGERAPEELQLLCRPGPGKTPLKHPNANAKFCGADVDSYNKRSAFPLRIVGTVDGCACQNTIDSDQSVRVDPVNDSNGRLTKGFTVVDSSTLEHICYAVC